MQKYRVLDQPVTINTGLVALTEKQVGIRSHCLKPTLEAGVYQVLSSFQFKKGEVFGYDGELPKNLLEHIAAEGDFHAQESFRQPPAPPPVPSVPTSPPPVPETASVPPQTEGARTVKSLAETLKLEIPDAIELLKDYGFEAKDETTVVDAETHDLVLADKTQEVE